MDLRSDAVRQGELDLDAQDDRGRDKLMSALDSLNDRYGRGTVFMASAGNRGVKRVWSMKQERRTPAYTTCLQDIPVVRA
jgi:DNA polymerase V